MKQSDVIALNTTKELSANRLEFTVKNVANFDEYLTWIEACDTLGRVPTQDEWQIWNNKSGPNGPDVA